MKILLVDDCEDNRWIVANTLRDEGHEVVDVGSAELALDSVDSSYDVVVTDFEMPKMNGATLTKKIRQRSLMMPIYMWSGYDFAEEIFIAAGGTKFFSKMQGKDLIDHIREIDSESIMSKRFRAIQNLDTGAWYSKQIQKLTAEEKLTIKSFILKNGEMDNDSYQVALNKFQSDELKKTRNWTLVCEILQITVFVKE